MQSTHSELFYLRGEGTRAFSHKLSVHHWLRAVPGAFTLLPLQLALVWAEWSSTLGKEPPGRKSQVLAVRSFGLAEVSAQKVHLDIKFLDEIS